ncbi:hypothetical protein [Mycolicibacterium sarraceniae]|uniref:Asp/Glu/hydantoin racemase n=1 Tax=Mycolicibacterium sarraceniae TaxID=1534348 RepID=A0A7I7SWZ0_9MYCO|nr:hypothetical protein [Mycolicibacterium sarraceniae]BBY60729.1 hypothetical protein MSAR_38650 [Mycolicibacterium sarraceniae]
MKILVLNPNTSPTMSAEIDAAARSAADLGTQITTTQPSFDADAVVQDGADVICLGCAGMAGVTAAITHAPGPGNPCTHWPLAKALRL